jgi:phosphatidate phosphatase
MHPYHESTVGISLLYVGIGLPMAIIVVVEVLRWKLAGDDRRAMRLFGRDIPNWMINIYKYVGLLLFGAVLTLVITDIGKHVIGRFRPHFMNVCQPIMPDGTNCTNPKNLNRYIEDFTCSNADFSEYRVRDASKSFPSGHSSLAMYSMGFAAFYVHRRLTWDGPRTLKPILEFSLITMAWYTALSRVSDYKHHCVSINVTAMHQGTNDYHFHSFRV